MLKLLQATRCDNYIAWNEMNLICISKNFLSKQPVIYLTCQNSVIEFLYDCSYILQLQLEIHVKHSNYYYYYY